MADLRVWTLNILFTKGNDQWRSDIAKVAEKADVICFQEAHNANLEKLIPNGWEVHQGKDPRNGSAVAWRKSRARSTARGFRKTFDPKPGESLQVRFIAAVTLLVDDFFKLDVASCHAPPNRDNFRAKYYGDYADAVVKHFQDRNHPMIIGADWNWQIDQNPGRIMSRLPNAKKTGFGIDGFVYDQRLNVKNLRRISDKDLKSDHPAVGVDIALKAPSSSPSNNDSAGADEEADTGSSPSDSGIDSGTENTFNISVVTSNLQAGSSRTSATEDINYVASDMGPDIWCVQEASDFLPILRSVEGMDVVSLDAAKGLPILYKKSKFRLIGSKEWTTAESVGKAPARHLVMAHLKHKITGVTVYAFNTKSSSGIESDGSPKEVPKTQQAKQHFRKMARIIQNYAEGTEVALWAGDLAVDEDADNKTGYAGFPDAIFEEFGLVSIYDELKTKATFDTLGERKVDIIGSVRSDSRIKAKNVRRSKDVNSNHYFVRGAYALTTTVRESADPTTPDPSDPSPPKQPSQVDTGHNQEIDHADCCAGVAVP